jgi:c-di-GMP-related signal transduction protein
MRPPRHSISAGRTDSHKNPQLPFFIARQPIYDRYRQVHAYEMLFRGLEDAGEARFLDGTTATAQLITQGWLLGGFDSLSDGRWVFVNFTRDLLVGGTPMLFNPARDVVEVLEDVPADPSVLDSCRTLCDAGYRVALDDIEDIERIQEFEGAATLAKVDFTKVELDELPAIARLAQVQGVQLVAEKIETAEALHMAEGYGFDFFQGYYLSRPESLERPTLPGLSPAHARLLEVVSQPGLHVDAVTKAVEADPSLTYKVLRTANSAAFAQQRRIQTVRDAVVLFGEEEMRRTALFVVLGAILDDSNHLLHESVTLARFCDEIGQRLDLPRTEQAEFYLVGMLSNVDALLGETMAEAMGRLPLSDGVIRALVRGEGAAGMALAMARAYMRAEWDEVTVTATSLGFELGEVAALYLDAVADSDAQMSEMAAAA